jgi:hypothetical protein
LFWNLQGIIDLDPEIAHGAFPPGMPKQKLHRMEIACFSADRYRFCDRSECVPYLAPIKAGIGDPVFHDPCILAVGAFFNSLPVRAQPKRRMESVLVSNSLIDNNNTYCIDMSFAYAINVYGTHLARRGG